MRAMLPSLIILSLVALVAMGQALRHRLPANRHKQRRRAATTLALATLIQALHFAEEASTGFHVEFPALFGQPPIPNLAFYVFNLACLLIWFISIPGLLIRKMPALFAAWFLALAGILNGLAHPLLALNARGYFPGLYSSPFVGAACFLLVLHLRNASGKDKK